MTQDHVPLEEKNQSPGGGRSGRDGERRAPQGKSEAVDDVSTTRRYRLLVTNDRPTPFTVADERTTLLDFLNYLRESLILKAKGISDDDARRPFVPSGTNLLGLVNHLAFVETSWFQFIFAGRDIQLPSGDFHPDASIPSADIISRYEAAVAESNRITTETDDLETLARRDYKGTHLSLRWILVHMIEETGRHAGHADIIRELIDGTTGR